MLCSPCSIGLDSTNTHSFFKSSYSLKCCRWRCKFELLLSTDTSMHTWHVSLSVRFPCKRGVAVPAAKARFWIECTVSTWRLKFLALVNSVPQIVQGKRNGLLECCCRTCHSISCLYAKVNGQNTHCTRCSVVSHLFLCWKRYGCCWSVFHRLDKVQDTLLLAWS